MNPSFSIYRTVPQKFYKIGVVDNCKKLDFCKPFLMTLYEGKKKKNHLNEQTETEEIHLNSKSQINLPNFKKQKWKDPIVK